MYGGHQSLLSDVLWDRDEQYEVCDSDYEDEKSDSESIDSEARYDLEVALYGQIHHEVAGNEGNVEEKNSQIIVLANATEKNGKITTILPEITPKKEKSDVLVGTNKIDKKSRKKSEIYSAVCVESNIDEGIGESNSSVICISDTEIEKEPDKTTIARHKTKKRKRKNSIDISISVLLESDSDVIDVSSQLSASKKRNPLKSKLRKNLKSKVDKLYGKHKSETDDSDVIVLDSDLGDVNNDIQLNTVSNIIVEPDATVESLQTILAYCESKGGNWDIVKEDQYRHLTRSYSSERYHGECRKCRKKGHLTKNCPNPKVKVCCICGGNHSYLSCKSAQCRNCQLPGHKSTRCKAKKRRWRWCYRCSWYGHFSSECPDIWRQYHLTTKPGTLIQRRPSKELRNLRIYCYNCGIKGHLGHECNKEQMDWYKIPCLPYVTCYKKILDDSKRRWKSGESSVVQTKPDKNRKISSSETNRVKPLIDPDSCVRKSKPVKNRKTSSSVNLVKPLVNSESCPLEAKPAKKRKVSSSKKNIVKPLIAPDSCVRKSKPVKSKQISSSVNLVEPLVNSESCLLEAKPAKKRKISSSTEKNVDKPVTDPEFCVAKAKPAKKRKIDISMNNLVEHLVDAKTSKSKRVKKRKKKKKTKEKKMVSQPNNTSTSQIDNISITVQSGENSINSNSTTDLNRSVEIIKQNTKVGNVPKLKYNFLDRTLSIIVGLRKKGFGLKRYKK